MARKTKAELEIEVLELRAQVATMGLDTQAVGHLKRIDAAAAPYERRLAELPALEAELARWDARLAMGLDGLDQEELDAWTALRLRVQDCKLQANESSALNQLYRQRADVEGIFKRGAVGRPTKAKKSATDATAPDASPKTLANVVRLNRGQGNG